MRQNPMYARDSSTSMTACLRLLFAPTPSSSRPGTPPLSSRLLHAMISHLHATPLHASRTRINRFHKSRRAREWIRAVSSHRSQSGQLSCPPATAMHAHSERCCSFISLEMPRSTFHHVALASKSPLDHHISNRHRTCTHPTTTTTQCLHI